ncbi:hypothetical protein ACWFRJ_39700 [Streptomyces sp. NPDC055239]
MNPDIQRELIPRDDTLRLIGALSDMKATFIDAAAQWQLLDDAGHVPASPVYAELIRHATDAQILAHGVGQMAAEVAKAAYSTNRVGSSVLAHLATAATMASHAAPHFADAAEAALTLPRSAERQFLENRMVIDHASARAFLRRTSESLRDAAKELDDHLGFQRFVAKLTPQEARPAPPPSGPSGRHR